MKELKEIQLDLRDVIQINEGGISMFMHRFGGGYTRYFKARRSWARKVVE